MKISRIFRPLTLVTALAGSTLYGCHENKSGNGDDSDMPTVATYDVEAARKRQEELLNPQTTTPEITQPSTIIPTVPSTVTQPSVPTTVTQPSIPTVPSTVTTPTDPTPVLPTPVTPTQPSVPSVTEPGERKPRAKPSIRRFMDNVSRKSESSGLGYFSVTTPQNFVGLMSYGRLQNPKLGDLSLDGYGAAGIANLDVRPFSFLRTEFSGSYAEDVARREGKDLVNEIGLARLGSELVLADNSNFYLSLGPFAGFNSVRNKDAVGLEPNELTAYLVGGKARFSLKGLGLEGYVSGLQSVEGKHKTEDEEFNYKVRELKAGLKQHLGKGFSLGVEGSDIFQETEDVTRFWNRTGSAYLEVKDLVKGLSGWAILSGRDIDAPGKQRANELEGRLRFLADLGYGLHFGIGGSYSHSKVRGNKGNNNYSVDALIALGF